MASACFSSLDDGLVVALVGHMRAREWKNLSSCCRRLCALVRANRVRSLLLHIRDMEHLLRTPPDRRFPTITRLTLEAHMVLPSDQGILCHGIWGLVDAVPHLTSVDLNIHMSGGPHTEWVSIKSPLLALQRLPALKRLSITGMPDSRSLQYHMPGLKQLTSLELAFHRDLDPGTLCAAAHRHFPPLARLTNLVRLNVGYCAVKDGPIALPPNLTSLMLSSPKGDLMAWWDHIAWSEKLQQVQIVVQTLDIEGHPSFLLHWLASRSNTTLTSLQIACDFEYGDDLYEDVASAGPQNRLMHVFAVLEEPEIVASAGAAAIGAALGFEVHMAAPGDAAAAAYHAQIRSVLETPLGEDQGWQHPVAHIVVPPSNLRDLSSLQHLRIDEGWWLLANIERHWRALADCTALQSLRNVHTCTPPPAGVAFPGVTRLVVTTGTSPGDTLSVLGAFPALRELELVLVPQEEGSSDSSSSGASSSAQVSSTGLQQLPHLASARLAVHLGRGEDQLAPYFNMLFPALSSLQRLELGWHEGVELLQQLPTLAALQTMTSLHVGWEPMLGRYGPAWALDVPALLRAVRTAPWLQEVELSPFEEDSYEGATQQQLVLGLQEALPALRLIKLHSDYNPWVEDAPVVEGGIKAVLRPGLVVTR